MSNWTACDVCGNTAPSPLAAAECCDPAPSPLGAEVTGT